MNQFVTRPKFLNLLKIRMPVMAVTSIAHRVSGVLLFLVTPVLIYMLARSLRGPDEYAAVTAVLQSGWVQLFILVIWWAVLHHLLAGIRFLLMDMDRGVHLPAAARSAWTVIVSAFGLTLLTALGVWL